jgi:aspartokinase
MRTVTQIVRQIVTESEVPLEAIREEILNFSAYAKQIHPAVEKLTWKSVKVGTITVALTRIAKELPNTPPLRPQITIDDLKIKYPLVDISFEKTAHALERLSTIAGILESDAKKVFVTTEGMSEISIVASAKLSETIQNHFGIAPKAIFIDLVGISVGFDPKYLDIPNTLYTLISAVASQRINIIELISTHTELMFVIRHEDREKCLEVLQRHFSATI